MKLEEIKNFTSHKHVNEVLYDFVQHIDDLLHNNIVGIYLFGSLSYDDFNPKRSDIDLCVVVKQSVSSAVGEKIKQLHLALERNYPFWKERIEASYPPLALFDSIFPPKQPRPYFGGGVFYFEAAYGNEWIINNYLLYHKSIALQGPPFKTLVNLIAIEDVQKASARDLYKEWKPKLRDKEWLNNSHYQSYLVLNLCRILYTAMQGDVGSKTISLNWVKNEYAPQWKNLIEEADNWDYGKEMKRQNQVLQFLTFVLKKVPPVN